MSDLKTNINELFNFAAQHGFDKTFSAILIIEDKSINHILETGSKIVPRQAIFTPANFERRFNDIADSGHSWINFHLAGVLKESLVIVVEVPDYENKVPRDFVSINFSLPTTEIIENNWDISSSYKIVG